MRPRNSSGGFVGVAAGEFCDGARDVRCRHRGAAHEAIGLEVRLLSRAEARDQQGALSAVRVRDGIDGDLGGQLVICRGAVGKRPVGRAHGIDVDARERRIHIVQGNLLAVLGGGEGDEHVGARLRGGRLPVGFGHEAQQVAASVFRGGLRQVVGVDIPGEIQIDESRVIVRQIGDLRAVLEHAQRRLSGQRAFIDAEAHRAAPSPAPVPSARVSPEMPPCSLQEMLSRRSESNDWL